jgi:hypothetical protein
MLIPLTNEDARRRALEAVQAAKPGWVVSISKPNRSTAQNSLYWAVLQAISEQVMPGGQTYHPDTWHTYFKTLFLPGRMKELPGGQMVELEPTTTGMTTAAFSEYVEQVIAWATERGLTWTESLSAMRVERDTIMQLPSIYQTER